MVDAIVTSNKLTIVAFRLRTCLENRMVARSIVRQACPTVSRTKSTFNRAVGCGPSRGYIFEASSAVTRSPGTWWSPWSPWCGMAGLRL